MDLLDIHELAILVVEPSATQAKIIQNELTALGVNTIELAESGAQALGKMRRQVPDLVVSTMYLPDSTAADLVQLMRKSDELADVPFMLISSETSFAMLDPLRQAGIIAILPKPFEKTALKRALASTIDYIRVDDDALADVDIDTHELQVLVVDDSATARKHISRVLGNLGINHIHCAENGLAAAKLLGERYFDLVVTDYNMPEMDGEQLTRYIREHSSQSSVPVLMVTSEESGSRLSAVQQAGVSGICDKPFDPQTVKQMIRNILREE